jgi:cell division protein FtsI (penicillin-binding protein 3)
MVKPQFVTEIRDNGALVKKINTEIINPMIASKETIGKAQRMLEGVCERGTGRSLQNNLFRIAGKTGTARIATDNSGYQKGMYQASFVGYFPADNPKYSMMVAINNPRNGYYGSSVSGPVFKEVALKVYATQMIKNRNETDSDLENRKLPEIKKGKTNDILKVAEVLKLETISGQPNSEVVKVEKETDKIVLVEEVVPAELIPDVRGMGAKNAIYLLENAGLNVKITGIGTVKKQSISPGTKIKKGQTMYLSLG